MVVFASICMSCVKCCRKQMAKKRSGPPQGTLSVATAADVAKKRSPRQGAKAEVVRKVGREEGRPRVAARTLVRMHRVSKSLDTGSPRHSFYNLDSGSVPDLAREEAPPPESILKRTSQFCSFESCVSSAVGGWVTPDQEER